MEEGEGEDAQQDHDGDGEDDDDPGEGLAGDDLEEDGLDEPDDDGEAEEREGAGQGRAHARVEELGFGGACAGERERSEGMIRGWHLTRYFSEDEDDYYAVEHAEAVHEEAEETRDDKDLRNTNYEYFG